MWDAETMFSNEQVLAAADSDNIVDTGAPDAGKGQPMYLQVNLSPGATGALGVTLKTAGTADMAGATELAKFTVPAATVLKGGVVLAAPLPTSCRRYLRLTYSGATGGKVTAGLTLGAQTNGL